MFLLDSRAMKGVLAGAVLGGAVTYALMARRRKQDESETARKLEERILQADGLHRPTPLVCSLVYTPLSPARPSPSPHV